MKEAGEGVRGKTHDAIDYAADRTRDAAGNVVADRAEEVKEGVKSAGEWVGDKVRGSASAASCFRLLWRRLCFCFFFSPRRRSLRMMPPPAIIPLRPAPPPPPPPPPGPD